MAMLQYYYTSCSNGTSGGAGFQCKALSPGITETDVRFLNSLLGYRIPSSKVEAPVTEHPAALRYEYLNSEKSVLVCSQSNGTDENGRPGNFFAHCVLTSPHDFDFYPPIMFWGSPFWKKRDDSSSLEIPPLPAFDLEPSLDFQNLWPFIRFNQRKQAFGRLLSAVILFGARKRPIVILDSAENIAMWIFAVSMALPRIYRQYISFATYHHDPYQASFLITGTTADSKFRFSPDEYISYFVLNMESNQISDIEETDYSKFILKNFSPELYDSVLLDFFQLCNEFIKDEPPENMNEALSAVTYFYQVVRTGEMAITDPRASIGFDFFFNYLTTNRNPSDADFADLTKIVDLLGAQVVKSPKIETIEAFGTGLRLHKKYNPGYLGHAREDMNFLLEILHKNMDREVVAFLSIFRDVYQETVLTQVVSRPEYLEKLVAIPPSALNEQMIIWKYLVPYIRQDISTRDLYSALIINALSTCNNYSQNPLETDAPPPEADQLLGYIISTSKNNQKLLLEIAAKNYTTSKDAFFWLYYKLVGGLSLPGREAYRNLTGRLNNFVLLYEVRRDVLASGVDGFLRTMAEWLHYTGEGRELRVQILEQGLDVVWKLANADTKYTLAANVLAQALFQSIIPEEWLDDLLHEFFRQPGLKKLTPAQLGVYERYAEFSRFTIQQRGWIGGSIAMTTGRFRDVSVMEIQRYLASLDGADYERESRKFIKHFFQNKINLDAHIRMVQSVYVSQYAEIFFSIYWENFKYLFFEPNRMGEFIDLLSFWFNEALRTYSKESPYLTPIFFMDMPRIIIEMSEEKSYDRIVQSFHSAAQNRDFYPFVKYLFDYKKRKGLLGIFR